ncbi:MAG: hypothetical protein ACYDAP_12640 [Thermoplasmataceae archaeon]
MGIPDYMKPVMWISSVAYEFGKYRKGLMEVSVHPLPGKRIAGLVDEGKRDPVSGNQRNDPYQDNTVEKALSAWNTELKQGALNGVRHDNLLLD